MAMTNGLPETVRANGFHIDGAWHAGNDRPRLERPSPGHGVPVSSVALCTAADADAAVAAARRAFDTVWGDMPGAARGSILIRTAAGIRERIEELAYWETLETGKPITQARGEIAAAADHYEAAAGMARLVTGETHNGYGEAMLGLVTRQPIGVVAVVTPWNFPFIVLAERLPFILAAGCSVVLKPSEMTSTTSLILADILAASGLPKGVYNVVTGLGPEVGEALSAHRDVDMISFTGSLAVGERVLAASRSNLKKVALELGGKNPQVVFADADLDDAADGVAFGLCFNAGQCCVSGSRLIVEQSVAEAFTAKVVAKLARVRLGDPLDPATQMGAIVSPQHHAKILGYVERGRGEGATLECGGHAVEAGGGRFIAPTVFSNVAPDMAIARDEIFGPVLSVQTFATTDEAVRLARDTEYGLAASVWSKDIDKALGVVRKMHAGRCWVNTTIIGGPDQPMGGFKRSGSGRECGMLGVEEYMEVKSIHVALGPRRHWVD